MFFLIVSSVSEFFNLFIFIFFRFLNIFLKYLFIYFWLYWVFVALHELSLVSRSGDYSSLWCAGFSLWCLLLLQSMGAGHVGFSSSGAWGIVSPWHVEPSWTRD